jgi:hypothetical protein
MLSKFPSSHHSESGGLCFTFVTVPKPPPPFKPNHRNQISIEFAAFPRLPAELRLKMWRYSFQPRIVNIRWSSDLRQYISPNNPAILHVSSEAREEGLKIYRPCFDTTFVSPSVVYFNFDLDIACIDWSTLGRPPGSLGRIAADCAKVKTYLSKMGI